MNVGKSCCFMVEWTYQKKEGLQSMPDTEQEYKKQIKKLEQQVQRLREQVDFLTRKLYGTKSEKTSDLEIEGQMSLFNEMESRVDPVPFMPIFPRIGNLPQTSLNNRMRFISDHFCSLCISDIIHTRKIVISNPK